MVGERNRRQLTPPGLRRQLLRPVGPVGEAAVQMEVNERHATLNSLDDARRAHQLALYLVEDAIHKLAAVLGGELLRDIHRFIDAYYRRNVIAMEHLVYRQPQNIAVHRRDAVPLPVLRVLLDDFVHLVPVFERAADERSEEHTSEL